MFFLKYSSRFKKDLKPYRYDKVVLLELEKVLDFLAAGKTLPEKYKNHPLSGEFKGCFDCHLKPDLILIYHIELLLLSLELHSHKP